MRNNSKYLIGKTLGSCIIQDLIQEGGMSVVYLAQQMWPSRPVAIKVLLPNARVGSRNHSKFLTRFRREANIIANLDHANIIPIYDYGEQDGLAYLVMPYFKEGTFLDLLTEHGPLSLQKTVFYIEQAAAALDYAHSQNVIHRDLKPSNFLLHSDGRLVLADFGIARLMSDPKWSTLTTAGTVLGTPEYMAPEMALGKQIDHRADIYELGIVTFQMLSGDAPFTGSDRHAIIDQHLHAPLPSLHQINPSIPHSVDVVLAKAAAKRREERYMSASDLAQALRNASTIPNFYNESTMVVLSPEVPLPTTTMEATIPSFRQNTHARTHLQPSKAHAFDHHKALPSASTRIRWFLWLLAGMILATFLVSGASLMASIAHKPPRQVLLTLPPQQPPSQTPTPSQQAKATVQQYYDYWNHKHYLAAYNLLAPEYQKKHPYSELYPSYVATERADITFESTTQLADGTVKVMITDRATEQSSSGTVTRTYHGYYIAAQENGTWKLTPHF